MKVLHVLQSPHFSGAENVVCQIIGMFKDDKDIEMVYCSCDGQIRDALKERNIAFYPMSKLSIPELKRVIKEYQPDIVHAHDMRASFVAAVCCGRIPLISHIHNNSFDSRGLNLKSIAYYFAAIKSKHIIWVSQSAFEGYCFHNSVKKKSSVLYNIIDMDQLYRKMKLDQNAYDYDVIFIGRISPQKNPHRFLEVFRLLAAQKPDIKMAVVGNGTMLDEIVDEAKQFALINNISFLGFQPNPLKMLYDSKVMIMTSLCEGTPMVALEALALGTPIVSTPVDGLKDIIANNQNGFLEDSNEVIASRILSIISDSSLRSMLSHNAQERSKDHNNVIDYKGRIEKIYRNCIRWSSL